jgi:hypothetical protein
VIRDFLVWLQTEFAKGGGDYPQTGSEALLGSLNFWGLLEGTHLLALMLFVGTIFLVDLRLLGVTFRRTPVSVISDRVLPMTIFGLVLVVVTGVALFYAKPVFYYHNIWFRVKLVVLALAMVNIAVFHFAVQRDRAGWDTQATPPLAARVSAAFSLSAWIAVIFMGRFIAYDWYECGKPQSDFINEAQSCATSERGALSLEGVAK